MKEKEREKEREGLDQKTLNLSYALCVYSLYLFAQGYVDTGFGFCYRIFPFSRLCDVSIFGNFKFYFYLPSFFPFYNFSN